MTVVSRKQPYVYAVTFEFAEDPPVTVRGVLLMPNPALAARRAIESAKRALPNRHWKSVSILLERGVLKDGG